VALGQAYAPKANTVRPGAAHCRIGTCNGHGVEFVKLLLSILLLILPWASAHSDGRVPPVFLTHFYVALDQASYDALRTSREVAALAAVVERHTVAGSAKWTGFYVRGRETYMEFFGAETLPDGMRPGDTGLGLTVEVSGGVAAIAARLRTAFGEKVEGPDATPRTTATGTIPWLTRTNIKSKEPEAMTTWFMEIDPGYLAAVHPGSPVEHPLSRQQYLSWDFLPDHPLDNVVGLTAALNPSEMARLATELQLVGWRVHRGGGGFVGVGPDVKLTVVPAGARAGIQQVELRLRETVPKQQIALGTAELLLDGKTGRFIFWRSN
jgi:hypothetical protein